MEGLGINNIIVTYDMEIRAIVRMFRKPLKQYKRMVKIFNCDTSAGYAAAIKYCIDIDPDTPYCKIEHKYADNPPIEITCKYLVTDLVYRARTEGARDAIDDEEKHRSDEAINARIERAVKWNVTNILEGMNKRIMDALESEIKETNGN